MFTGVKNLEIVTPSKWLSNLVKQSFLKDYKVEVINNGIDTNIFKKLDPKDLKFRKKYNLEDKKIILGVASPFTVKKGFNDFIELSKIISDPWVIVLVGLNKKQLKKLPNNVIGIEKTCDVNELVDIYNSANVFFNPTYEDNYPTVNLEAISCDIPVVTYDTGGSGEFTDFLENDKCNIIKKEENINNKKIILLSIETIINNDFHLKSDKFLSYIEMVSAYLEKYKVI